MLTLKKLTFAPFFLIVFTILIYQLNPLLKTYNFIFSLSINTLTQFVVVAVLFSLSSLLFCIFVSLTLDWKFILAPAILSSLMPLLFLETSLAIILSVTILVSLFLTYLNLTSTLKSYLTFQPSSLLGPSIRHLSGFLILFFCLVYFLSLNKIIVQNGFQIPDSLIDTALNFAGQSESSLPDNSPQINIPKEQLDFLKQNPDLLKQYGLDPSTLDSLGQPDTKQLNTPLANDLIKQTVKEQINNFLKPYLGFMPAALAIMLFLTLQSLTSIINLLIYPLLWIIFYALEKTGFIKFTVEQRPVKKMVI